MRILRATPDDAAALTAIAHAAKRYWGYPETWIEAWREQLTVTPEWISARETWKAVDAAGIHGFVGWIEIGRRVRLEHLWITPDAMGRSLGRTLFEHACRCVHAAGWPCIEITADPNAEGFYLRMGARRIGEEPGDLDGVTRVLPVLEYTFAPQSRPLSQIAGSAPIVPTSESG